MTLTAENIAQYAALPDKEKRRYAKLVTMCAELENWLLQPEIDALDKFMKDNPNHIYSQQYQCCGASATVLFFLHGNGIKYTILWPWGQFEKGYFDILEHLEEDFLDWMREYVCCTIAVEYAAPIPQYRAAVLFAGTRNVK
jgi:hypothetical protein